jgi:hypothetical protein
MSIAARVFPLFPVVALVLCASGCEEEKKPESPAPSATPALAPKPTAPTVASAPPKLRDDCPEGSSGEGTFNNPCEGKGAARQMEVVWNGKIGDQGPSFKVTNKGKKTILYGKIVVYFYDKAGKQLEIVDKKDPEKKRPYETCAGNIFGGVMKVNEKAVFTFSCVKKDDVPEGTKAIEGEMWMVGFTGDSDDKSEYYWRNTELAAKERPKGGLKAK